MESSEKQVQEKLIHLDADGADVWIRPGSVHAIEPRLLGGSDVYFAATDGGKAQKIFVDLTPGQVAKKLGLA